ncbi:MAG: ABC transporter transmembrane domain-containing protein [Chloroflexota bacterium]
MGFILDGLETESYDRSYSDRQLIGRIVRYFQPYTRQMILVGLVLTLSSIAGTGGPILISRTIDVVKVESSSGLILLLTGGVLLMGAARWVFNYIQQWFSARVVGDVVLDLREDVFEATSARRQSRYKGVAPPC